MSDNILEARNLSKVFGGLVAINHLDFSITQGKITAVIGPNGAGKTTLFNMITGLHSATEGDILFQSKPLNSIDASKRVRMGIARTFQNVLLFGDMTVLENVMCGRHIRSGSGLISCGLHLPWMRREEETIRLDAMHFLNFVEQGAQAERLASEIPLGQQKLVAIGRSLATEPKLLLLDEPGAGLNAIEKRGLSDLIKRICENGTTVVLVEHDMDLVMGTAEHVIVLDYGQKIGEGTPQEVQHNPDVITAYLGEDEEEEEA